jgi:competence protein ComEC
MQTIPCSIYWYTEKNRPKADCDYVIEGTLFPTQNGAILRPHFHKEWTPQLSTFSLAELRFGCKAAIRRFFEKNLHSQEAASFLNALITGDLFERSLKFSFQQIGLSHVLVISGFHFAFITALAAFMLRLFLPFSKVLWCLFVIVNAYFFFLGSTPSIQRAWMVIQLYLLSKILGKKTSGTQLLGFALLIELILDPLMAKNIGLQLSFLSCLGILLLFTPFDNFLSRFLLKRNLLQVKELSFSSQMGFILGSFFRKSIALSLAVNASLLPVLLWHFHKFPLLGLVYNLFFPFLVMLNMALMIITLLLYPLFPFSLKVLDHFTSLLLTLTSSPPASLQYNLYCKSFPLSWLILYLTALFLTAICFSRKERSIL